MRSFADDLIQDGVVVIPVGDNPVSEAAETLKALEAASRDAPEFVDVDAVASRTLGFPAHSYPSAFHVKAAWQAREKVLAAAVKHLGSWIGNRNVSVMHDRHQLNATSASTKAFHSDKAPVREDSGSWGVTKGDDILQGIYNIGGGKQHLSCWKGSHMHEMMKSAASGFAPVGKSAQEAAERNKTLIDIPEGHVCLFVPSLMHKVHKYSKPVSRVYTPLHITLTHVGFAPDKELGEVFDPNIRAVPRLPSCQEAALYSRLHLCNHSDKLEKMSKGMVGSMTTTHTFKTGTRAGKSISVPYRFSKSMAQRKLSTDGAHFVKTTRNVRAFYTPSRGPWITMDGTVIPKLVNSTTDTV
eukprot:m.140401 g.140401  ORF g.140401 m.140401 type:complete len:355 (+) comp11525_c0_seq2:202-1266(+)